MADQITEFSGTVPALNQSQPDFDQNTQDIIDYIANLAPEINSFVGALNSLSTTTASTSSVAIGTGTKNFTVETGKSLFVGMSFKMAYDANNWMLGDIISYDSGTGALSIDVDTVRGSGTYAAWVGTLSFNGQIETPQYADESVTSAKLSDDAFISIIGDSKNLIITNNSGTPNSQVDIDADEIILKNADGRAYLAEAVNLTANIAASGANGLDTGVEANSTWYYLWVIYNGTTVASLISASSTAPTLPSGYTYKALMGAIYNDGSGNFKKMYQVGRKVNSAWELVTNTIPTASYVSISLAAYVPLNAKRVLGTVYGVASASNTLAGFHSPTDADNVAIVSRWFAGSGSSSGSSFEIEVPISTAQTIYYKRGSTAFAAYEFYAHGWEF